MDGLIDVLYSSPDHDFPEGITGQQLRSRSDDEYGLRSTKHAYTPPGIVKPNPGVLRKILSDEKVDPASTVYIGDSRMKDVLMAQEMGANDVLAVYGAVSDDRQYELLRSVSHWTAEDVERERQINARGTVVPTHAVQSFAELLSIFDFRAKDG